MSETQIFYIISGAIILLLIAILGAAEKISKRAENANAVANANTAALREIAKTLATYNQQDSFIKNLDIVYQELSHHLTPILRILEIQPRQTFEHNIWRMTGGLIDAKDANPFVLEQLRRNIKLDSEFATNVDAFLIKAQHMLERISALDPDGILGAAFSDGLLGQSINVLSAARQMASVQNDRN